MGRPIRDSNFGNISAGTRLTVIADLGAGNEPCWIVKQNGTRTYTVSSVAGGATPTRTGRVKLQEADPAATGEAQMDVFPFGVSSGDGTLELSVQDLRAVTAVVTVRGEGYVIADTLTVVGGTQSEQAIFDVNDLSTVQGQTQADITVFAGGTGYDINDVLTLSDGSTITVVAEGSNIITQFIVTTASTTGIVGDDQVLTTVSSVPSGANDATFTMATATQGVFDVTVSATDGVYTVPILTAAATATGGAGSDATLTTLYGINSLSIDNAGLGYTTGATLTETAGAGTGSILAVASVGGSGDVTGITITDPGTGFIDLTANIETEAAGAEHVRTLTQYGVKTYEGNVYSWDLVTVATIAGFSNIQNDG